MRDERQRHRLRTRRDDGLVEAYELLGAAALDLDLIGRDEAPDALHHRDLALSGEAG
jgi:hypothetical protein